MSQELYLSLSNYGVVSGGPWVWRRGLSVRPCGFWQPSCEEARPLGNWNCLSVSNFSGGLWKLVEDFSSWKLVVGQSGFWLLILVET
jgi:hypothetical protein